MKGNESTTALTPVQLPARSKILQASIQLIKIQRRCDQKGLTFTDYAYVIKLKTGSVKRYQPY